MKKSIFLLAFMITIGVLFSQCSKLDEELRSEAPEGTLQDAPALLKGVYGAMRDPYEAPWGLWGLQEFTTDAALVPTRGPDWYDGGKYIRRALHSWTVDDGDLEGVYNGLNGVVYSATNLLQFDPTPSQEAQARFLRAFATFSLLDVFGKCAYREPGELTINSPRVREGEEAVDFIISELNAIQSDLPEGGQATVANKDAARTLLMRTYLNKGVFLNRETPTFAAEDMNQVISLADAIIASNRYSLTPNYFDNFGPNNNTLSKENIFTGENIAGVSGSTEIKFFWIGPLNGGQFTGGYNGFCTTKEYYEKFEAADQRRGGDYTNMTNISGIRTGFLVGQQYNQNGVALKDGKRGAPLIYDSKVALEETDDLHMLIAGIRVIKYPIDYGQSSGHIPGNDWVYLRYADVLMMKAEALLRTNKASEALTIINQIRAVRGASRLGSLTLDILIDERAREFFWEGNRRTDLIRFGKFLTALPLKPGTDDKKYLLFPIPSSQISDNMIQNPGF